MPERPFGKRATLPLILLFVGIVADLSACGSGSSSDGNAPASGATSASGSADAVAAAKASLAKISTARGDFALPPTDAPKATPGKKVVVVSFGQGVPAFAVETKEIVDAGRKLGWSVRVWDGKFSPNQWIAGVRSAITEKADGIITIGPDCASIKAPLTEARQARIPVINVLGHDCDTTQPGARPLFTHTVHYQQGTLVQFVEAVARYQADWAIAHAEGKAKVVLFDETDAYTFKVMADAFKAELGKCTDCKVVSTVTLTGTDYGPKLQQKAQQAFLKYPEANIVWPAGTETLLPAGIAAAIRSSQSKPVATGWECDTGSAANFANKVLGMCLNYIPQWEAYAAVDALVRVFGGQQPSDETGMGIRLIDPDHSFAGFRPYQSPLDFRATYEQAWGAQ